MKRRLSQKCNVRITKVNNDMFFVKYRHLSCSGVYRTLPREKCDGYTLCKKNRVVLENRNIIETAEYGNLFNCCLLLFEDDIAYYSSEIVANIL